MNFHKGCFLLTRGYIDKFGDFGILDTNNLSKVDTVKREIIELYFDDFLKIDPSGRASQLFMAIPSELSKNASRYQVSSVLSDSERKNLSEVLIAMKDSMVVNFSYHSNDPNVGFALNSDKDQYKMFIGDTGLFITLAFWDKDVTEEHHLSETPFRQTIR